MKVYELMEILEDMDGEAEVRFAHQPSWAFEYSIANAASVEDDNGNVCLYLAEGRQIGYLPGKAARALDW